MKNLKSIVTTRLMNFWLAQLYDIHHRTIVERGVKDRVPAVVYRTAEVVYEKRKQ